MEFAEEPLMAGVAPEAGLMVMVLVAFDPPFAGTTIGKVSALGSYVEVRL
jgi:hypothetical protein